MGRKLCAVTVAVSVLFILSYESRVAGEYIFINDGSIIEGEIISDTKTSMILREPGGRISSIRRDTVTRVLYDDQFQERLVISTTGGKKIRGYIVEETEEHFIVREDLSSPDEMNVRKASVTLTERSTPSGLMIDDITSRGVHISWRAPGMHIKNYHIYTRKEGTGFTFHFATGSNSHRLEGLDHTAGYEIMVKSVDRDNYESSPSNVEWAYPANPALEPRFGSGAG